MLPFRLSPAGRATLIMTTFFFGLVGITTYAVLREGRRISHQKRMTHEENARSEGEMAWMPAGRFTMGGIGETVPPDELPLHDLKLDGFWIDQYEVTNAQFETFVRATRYVTVAERPRAVKTTPDLPAALEGKAASLCFHVPEGWLFVEGANWRHPSGPDSDIIGKAKHPVVHVAFEDAMAFAQWAGKRLPSETEWEYAARGGLIAKPFVWGSEQKPDGKWPANIWQGPTATADTDGFDGIAPVGSFPPNNFGLFDVAGNVWEITADWYRADAYSTLTHNGGSRELRHNPHGPADSLDPEEPGVPKKVARGGSWQSGPTNGAGYRPSARRKITPIFTSQDLGFRCAKDGTPP